MKNILITVIIVLALIVLIVVNKQPEETNGKSTVKIGIALPLTGNVAFAGQPAKAGAELALEKWNKVDTKYNYKLVMEDNQYILKNMANIANKFLNIDKVNAMISMFGTEGKLFSAINNKSSKPIPHFACAWGTSAHKGDYNFNTTTSSEAYAVVIVDKMKKENIKRVGIINLNSSESIEMIDVITEKMEQENIDVVFNEIFNVGEKDYRMFLSKIKDIDLDIIYFQLFPDDANLLKKQLIEMNIDVPLTTSDNLDGMEDASAYEGVWYVSAMLDDRPDIRMEIEKRSGMSNTSCSSNTYDNVDIIINAFENAHAEDDSVPTSESVLNYLKQQDKWNGASAKEMTFRSNGSIDLSPAIFMIKNGKRELVRE